MAFGASPKFEKEFQLEELSQQEFLVIAIEAAKELSWNIGTIHEHGFIAYSGFSMRSYGEEIKIDIQDKEVKLKSECTSSQLFDYGKNKGNVEDLILTCKRIKGNFTKEEFAAKFEELKKSFLNEEEKLLSEGALNVKSQKGSFFSLFVPSEGYYVTPILVNLNILIFILMVITGTNVFLPENEDLLAWGANFRPMTLDNQWWRLLTCCFLHIGVFHLLMNMYALIYIGLLLEPILGTTRFLAAYLVTGIAASLTSLGWHDYTISAGASGAIFGMYGVFLAMLTTNLIEKSARQSLLSSIVLFVGYNLVNGLKGGVDNAAHIGGLLSGMVVGYIYYPALKDAEAQVSKKTSIILISATVLLATVFMCSSISNDVAIFDQKMEEFSKLETEALIIYNLPDTTSDDYYLKKIQNPGISNWKRCVEITEEVKRLDLPENIMERNKLLKYYCRLRIESYRRFAEYIKDTTRIENKTEFEIINQKIEKTIEDIKRISE
ncbi:MAG: rhomboid family intramembrane serine protease [Bacteroidetes bacterium]|nr:rhomboid family intramembrane serine protease [Bacteroidota bacterium]